MNKLKSFGLTTHILFFFVVLGVFTSVSRATPFAYITNSLDDTVSVIDIATNTVVDTI